MTEFLNITEWQNAVGFSQAAIVPPAGTRILLSGVGSEATGQVTEVGSIAGQCRAAWANIADLLEHAGATLADIVRVRSYVTDPRHLAAVTQERKAALGDGPYPLHTFLVVSALALPEMLVEIEVEAVVHA